MIRWKQAQIHRERKEREDQRDLLTMEYAATEKFLAAIPKDLQAVKAIPPQAIPGFLSALAQQVDKIYTDPMRQESLKRMKNWPGNWDPPTWGDVLRSHVPWNQEIIDISKATDEFIAKGENLESCASHVLELFDAAFERFKARQPVIKKQIQEFEDQMNKKLTMDSLHTGFDKTVHYM